MKKINLSIATLLAALSIATAATNAYAQDGVADGSGCPCCNGSSGARAGDADGGNDGSGIRNDDSGIRSDGAGGVNGEADLPR